MYSLTRFDYIIKGCGGSELWQLVCVDARYICILNTFTNIALDSVGSNVHVLYITGNSHAINILKCLSFPMHTYVQHVDLPQRDHNKSTHVHMYAHTYTEQIHTFT